ncbi:Alpha/Beta hydrolase protein [Cladorrhinum sp. PSN259]|nr:Alpha/Beta hydrolase protein [Cladorrhinum sp. PSN259]
MYLVKRLGVDSRDVVLSGDSAGGNLALALLRYLQDHADEGKLPLPGGVLLWSPWVDLTVPPLEIAGHRNARYDVVLPQSALWGYRVFIPEDRGAEDAYISPVKKAIPTRVPIWLNWGGREVFADQIKEFVETQRKHAGSRVGTYEVADAPHDLFGVGEPLGWVKETKEAFGHAVRFLNES